MATPDIEVIEISLLSGRSDRPSMTFSPGTPAPTLSLGSAGQWAIAGEGVGPVHVFVTFDGQSVHVAAAVANLPVALAGAAIGTGWTKAPIPCELRFGGACVILRRTSRPGAFTQEEATVHDGGALWQQAAQRANQPQINPAQINPAQVNPAQANPPTGLAATMASQIASVRPAAGMPAEQTHAMASPQQQYTSSHPPAPMDLTATTPMADAQKFRDAVTAAQAAGAMRPPIESSPTTVRQPQPPMPEAALPPVPYPPGQEPLGELEKTVIAPHPPRPPAAAPDLAGGFVQAPPPAMAPSAMPAGAPQAPIQPEKPLNYWQAASPVKKATLVLMPFALVMAFLMLRDEPPPPPRVAGTSSASAKHAKSDGGALAAGDAIDAGGARDGAAVVTTSDTGGAADAGLAANGSSDTKPDAKQDSSGGAKVVPLTGSKRTTERQALDSVAAGSFDEAAKRYDTLAAAHADDPSYKEAARILHEKAGN